MDGRAPQRASTRSGRSARRPPPRAPAPAFARRPHLAFFLHDEVILHVPLELADAAADAVRDAAASASRLLFGDFPIDFPLDLHIAETAEKA